VRPLKSLANARAHDILLSGDEAPLRSSPRRMAAHSRRPRLAAARRFAVTLTVLSTISCSRNSGGNGEIGIGVALDPKRAGMQSIYNGVQLAVDQLNAQRGGRGGALRMIKGDANVSDPIRIAETLRDNPSVVGVVGHPESGTTLDAIGEYADTKNFGRNAVVAISPTGTSPALSGANRWLFRVCPSDVQTSRTLAQFVLDSMHSQRASVIYRNDAYGRDWSKSFSDAYREGKGIVIERDPYLAGVTPWDSYAGYMKKIKPDVILFPGSTEDAVAALRALKAVGESIPLVGGDATSGLEANAAEFPNVRYAAFFLARRATTPQAKAFIQAYRAEFKEDPDQRAALAYDAAMLIGRAALEVGADRGKIRDYIESINGTTRPAYEGVAGPIKFDANHDAVNKPVVVAQVGK
jgi:branched-chain amino acid transport system substrate-binding protein